MSTAPTIASTIGVTTSLDFDDDDAAAIDDVGEADAVDVGDADDAVGDGDGVAVDVGADVDGDSVGGDVEGDGVDDGGPLTLLVGDAGALVVPPPNTHIITTARCQQCDVCTTCAVCMCDCS